MRNLTAAVVLAVAPLVAACAGPLTSPSGPKNPSPSPPTPAATIRVDPSRASEPIGPLPDDCEPGPKPAPVSDHVADAIGGEPVWAIGFGGPAATLSFGPGEQYEEHGWLRKVLWLLRRHATHPVTVTGVRVDDGSRLWFDYEPSAPPAAVLLLDPAAPHGQHGDWFEYRGYFVAPSAGCYRLAASWAGGGWELAFRAGLDETLR